MVADIYRPAGAGPFPAMVLLLGVNPLPRDDDQVRTLADGIARTGIVTAVAESQALLDGHIRLDETDNLVALFHYLERDPQVDPRRIGFSGFCVGAVLQLLAAADPRIAPRVAYVNAFSVYAFSSEVLRAMLTERMPTPEGPKEWIPSQLTRTVFLRHLIEQLPSDRDRSSLTRELLEATPLTSPEIQALSASGRQVRGLITSRDPAAIDAALATLPPDLGHTLELLSPGHAITNVQARTFLMHDQHDTYLPVSGARQLASLGASQRLTYTEFQLFEHVVPGKVDDPRQFGAEILKLFKHIHAVLLAAHTGRAPA